MSDIIDKITAFVLKQVPRTPNISVKVDTTKSSNANFSNDYPMLGNRYNIKTTWSMSTDVEPCHLDAAMENFKRELKEAIYGDLKHRIQRLEIAVLEENRDKILMETRDIIRKIFY